MFSKVKSWDNRTSGRLLPNGRTWTRRITWMEDENDAIKLKLEYVSQDGEDTSYKEVLCDAIAAETIWKRFREGQPIDDAISILGNLVPKSLKSKKAGDHE